MRTGEFKLTAVALATIVIMALAFASAQAGAPPKKPKPPPASPTAYCMVLAQEYGVVDEEGTVGILPPDQWVFWGEDENVMGAITGDESDDNLIINTYLGGAPPICLHFGNLPFNDPAPSLLNH